MISGMTWGYLLCLGTRAKQSLCCEFLNVVRLWASRSWFDPSTLPMLLEPGEKIALQGGLTFWGNHSHWLKWSHPTMGCPTQTITGLRRLPPDEPSKTNCVDTHSFLIRKMAVKPSGWHLCSAVFTRPHFWVLLLAVAHFCPWILLWAEQFFVQLVRVQK